MYGCIKKVETKPEGMIMKILLLLTALLLCNTAAFGQGGEAKMSLQKRVSTEKILLTEKYQSALQKCRERTRKKAKESCLEQKKNEFGRIFAELEQDPRAYFAAQERNEKTEKDLQEINSRQPRQ